jgi:DNA-binding Lrp family transcriptional regulator
MDLAELDPDERAFWERYILTGIHAFLFVDHVAGERRRNDLVKTDLAELIPTFPPPEGLEPFSKPVVLSASEFVGSFGAFVHLWAPPGQLAALQDFIGYTLWDLGLRCTYATQATSHQGPDHIYPMKVKKCDVVAVVRIWVKKGAAAGALLPRLAQLRGFQGAATVFGDFDVLLVLEGEDYSSVAEVALGELQAIHGIKRTETAFADYRRNDEPGPES